MYVLTAFLVLGGFPYTRFDTGDKKFHSIFTNFCLNDLCYHRFRFEIKSYTLCSAFCYFISMCVILIFVDLHVFPGMSAILDVFVLVIKVAFSLAWELLGLY